MPTLRYRDLDAAVDWLCAAFGFVPHHLVRNADGNLVSAQLAIGPGLVMLVAAGQSVFDELLAQPDELGGAETQSCYFIIDDCDAHYTNAVAHDASIVLDVQTFETGGRGYMCRDPQGHLWSFGTYDPWVVAQSSALGTRGQLWSRDGLIRAGAQLRTLAPNRKLALAGLTAVGIVAAGTAASMTWRSDPAAGTRGAAPQFSAIAIFKERGARIAAERKALVELARVRQEKEAAELDLAKAQEELAHVSAAKDTSASTSQQVARLTEQVARLQQAKDASDKTARLSIAKSLRDRQAREKLRRKSNEWRDDIAGERQARQRADKTAQDLKSQLDREMAAADAADTDRLKVQEMLTQEREAKAKVDAALQQALDDLKREQQARKAAEAAATATSAVPSPGEKSPGETSPGEAPEGKTFAPPRPAKRPDSRRRD